MEVDRHIDDIGRLLTLATRRNGRGIEFDNRSDEQRVSLEHRRQRRLQGLPIVGLRQNRVGIEIRRW